MSKVAPVRFVSHVKRLQAGIRAGADKAARAVALDLQGKARKAAPHDTGQLRASIAYDVEDGVAVVGTNAEHAIYQHEGTGKYASNGRGRKTPWVYYDVHRGVYVFTHGNPATKFLERPFLENRRRYQQMIQEGVAEGFARAARDVAKGELKNPL